MRWWFVLIFVGIGSSAWPRGGPPVSSVETGSKQVPWFTGPLLAYSAVDIPKGHFNFEPYVFANYQASSYNSDWKKVSSQSSSWNINSLTLLQFGLTDWLDLTLTPSWFFRVTEKATSFNLGDFNVVFGLQLLVEKEDQWYPSIRLALHETFPVGRFERLDPEQDGTDVSGAGAYTTGAILAFSRVIRLWDNHWTRIRFGAKYDIPSKVRVRGYSAYGGAFDTNGWVYAPQSYQIYFAFEFNMTQRWVLACDAVASFSKSTRFKGYSGFNELTGLPADLTSGSSAQYSIAPALEYNWNAKLGVISGVWFTLAGRNAQAFTNWVTALNYYY